VATLLLNGEDPNVANTKNGETALHRAAANNKADVIVVLLRFGADPNAAAIGGATPLHYCSGQKATSALLTGGADPSATGQGVCYAIGGQKHLFAGVSPSRRLALSGRSDLAAMVKDAVPARELTRRTAGVWILSQRRDS
jgi:hypothetical protein